MANRIDSENLLNSFVEETKKNSPLSATTEEISLSSGDKVKIKIGSFTMREWIASSLFKTKLSAGEDITKDKELETYVVATAQAASIILSVNGKPVNALDYVLSLSKDDVKTILNVYKENTSIGSITEKAEDIKKN